MLLVLWFCFWNMIAFNFDFSFILKNVDVGVVFCYIRINRARVSSCTKQVKSMDALWNKKVIFVRVSNLFSVFSLWMLRMRSIIWATLYNCWCLKWKWLEALSCSFSDEMKISRFISNSVDEHERSRTRQELICTTLRKAREFREAIN